MLAYNGSIPGPTLHVDQGSEITVHVANDGDVETTVHWHGLRLDNRYDGVPDDTQAPIVIGGAFTYRPVPRPRLLLVPPPPAGGLRAGDGPVRRRSSSSRPTAYWPPVDRQSSLTLDDLLIEDGRVAPFRRSGPTFTAMGRFGNVLLVNGQTAFTGGRLPVRSSGCTW